MSKHQKLTLRTNIGANDARTLGLGEKKLEDLAEGKTITVTEEQAAVIIGKGWATTGAEGTTAAAAAEPEEESPLADTPVDQAVQMIANMRSKDKLNALLSNDKRVGIQTAAQKRLKELG